MKRHDEQIDLLQKQHHDRLGTPSKRLRETNEKPAGFIALSGGFQQERRCSALPTVV
jgi:hypothetical protein